MKYAVVIEKGPTSYGAHRAGPARVRGRRGNQRRGVRPRLITGRPLKLYVEALEEDGLVDPGVRMPHSYELVEV